MSTLIHIFKPGTHQPMEGEPITFTLAHFQATASAYNMDTHEAPLVVGHPKHNNPAYGWVKQIVATPDGLFIEPHQVDSEFQAMVKAGRFKKISPSFYEPDEPCNPMPGVYYLRHVGFLGAMPPSVKGLKPAEFSDGGKGIVVFNEEKPMADETTQPDKKGLLAKLIAFLTKELGEDKAAEIITEEGAQAITEAVKEAAPDTATTDLPTNAGADELLPEVAAQLAAVSEENLRLKAENEELQEDKDADGESADFAEVIRRKVAPRHRPAVRAMLKAASKKRGTSKLEFSEGGKNKPLTPALQEFIRSLPDVVNFSEVAKKGAAAKQTTANPLLADAERRANHQK